MGMLIGLSALVLLSGIFGTTWAFKWSASLLMMLAVVALLVRFVPVVRDRYQAEPEERRKVAMGAFWGVFIILLATTLISLNNWNKGRMDVVHEKVNAAWNETFASSGHASNDPQIQAAKNAVLAIDTTATFGDIVEYNPNFQGVEWSRIQEGPRQMVLCTCTYTPNTKGMRKFLGFCDTKLGQHIGSEVTFAFAVTQYDTLELRAIRYENRFANGTKSDDVHMDGEGIEPLGFQHALKQLYDGDFVWPSLY